MDDRQSVLPGMGEDNVTRVYVCAPPEDSRLLVSAFPPGNPTGIEVVSFGSDAATLESDVEELDVSVVIISPLVRNYDDGIVARLAHRERLTVVIGLVPSTGDWARQLNNAGATDVLRTPVTDQTVQTLIGSMGGWLRKASQRRLEPGWVAAVPAEVQRAIAAMGYRQGVWSFWSPKGGVGKTTLACNVAALLGVVGQRKTLLLDGNMNGGHVDIHMGVEHEMRLPGLAQMFMLRKGNLLPRDLQDYARPWRSGAPLDVLPGIKRVEQAGEPALVGDQGGRFMNALVAVAKQLYEFIIIDLGSTVNSAVHRQALLASDGIVVITTPDRCSVLDVRTTLDTLQSLLGLERSKYTLVVNMWTPEAGLSRSDITRFVGLAEGGVVPTEIGGAMTHAVNLGQPFALLKIGSRDPQDMAVVEALAMVTGTVYPPFRTLWENRGGALKKPGKGILGELRNLVSQ